MTYDTNAPELGHFQIFAPNAPVDASLLALAQRPFIEGRQPFAESVELSEVGAEAALLPPGTAPERVSREGGRHCRVGSGPGWTLYAHRRANGNATVWAFAETAELAHEVAALAAGTAEGTGTAADSAVSMGFWHSTVCRPEGIRSPRPLDVPGWADIRGNYPASAVPALDRLMAQRPDALAGRLVLLHGPAGTGKTTVLRALAHAWRDWCRVECVLDPEALFAQPGYLMAVALGEDQRPGASAPAFRLIVLEDCDELVRAEAKHDAGQSLSRLLNLTDGLLGQGLDVLVCLTTNEDLSRLHPAVVRPGRCLAEIEIGPLPPAEAAAWLGVPGAAGADLTGSTLAELYRRRAVLAADA